jgi:hypothetical protein
MADATNFWEPVSDRPAGLTPRDIAQWEDGHKISLPAILAQALLVQN